MKLRELEVRYVVNDTDVVAEVLDLLNNGSEPTDTEEIEIGIEKVIFNGPATIILWSDGTKTVIKCRKGDVYSKEGGFALCVLKKLTGPNFHRMLKDLVPEDKENIECLNVQDV